MGEREQRMAENETRFREANESLLDQWHDMDMRATREVLFICECGYMDCTQVMRLTMTEYESVRSDPNTFALISGHDDRPTEQVITEEVVEKNDRFAVVRKRPENRVATEASDPRAE
jgi:hypothetical protein